MSRPIDQYRRSTSVFAARTARTCAVLTRSSSCSSSSPYPEGSTVEPDEALGWRDDSLHRFLPRSYTVEGLRHLLYSVDLVTVARV